MDNPLVSILIPVYRVENDIERCVRSVMEQTYDNLEYVIVDDATDDSSMEILKRILRNYPNRLGDIQIIHHKKNRGLAAARNTAVSSCRGEYVFHVDSDDWVESNAVKLLVEKQRETGADIVTAEAYDYNAGVLSKHQSGGWNLDKESLLVGLLTYRVSTVMWRRLIRKRLYMDNNITCDERGSGGEDFQVFPRLVYYANIVSGINDCVYYHNKSNRTSISNTVWKDVNIQKEGLISVKVIVDFFSDKELYLRNIVSGMDVRNVHYRMVNNVVHKNKIGYQVFLRNMQESDTRYWSLVRWDKPMVRRVESNYYALKLKQKGSRMLARLKKVLN